MTTSQAARELNLSRERVRQLADAGHLKVEETPLGRLFDGASVQRLAESRRVRAQEKVAS